MPRKPKLDATQAQGEAAAPQADTQVVEVFADLPAPDVEEDATFYDDLPDDVPGRGYSEADNPSNGWQAPEIDGEQDSAPDAGLAYGPADLGYPGEGYYACKNCGNAVKLDAECPCLVDGPPPPDVDPGATDPPPVSVNASEPPAPSITEAEAHAAQQAAVATAHLVRLNAMTRGELMAYAADELGIKVRDTNPKPKIIDTIMGVLVKDHVPGSIKASVVAHRSVGGGVAQPSKPKLPQAKLIAIGLACPGCGTFLAQEDGRTTWTIGQDFLPDTHTCACGVTMQTPKELHAPPVAPAEATPTELAATAPQAVAA